MGARSQMGWKRGLRRDEDMKMKTMVRQVLTGAATVVAMATLPGVASAGPINGFLAIAGGVTYDTVGTSGNAILDWAPTGTGFLAGSSTYNRTFAIGRPIGAVAPESSPDDTQNDASIVASVGP